MRHFESDSQRNPALVSKLEGVQDCLKRILFSRPKLSLATAAVGIGLILAHTLPLLVLQEWKI